ncbi:unnamed protein product [Caenorhabditis bovis]|uniref:Uncharacterized protein n=1 Tax=Caenorhabditis bovis TaxID=2654633 RepID=A0A8S1EYE9_9PELO|nr:unnamed protein product [Caenorhabditis bovis]
MRRQTITVRVTFLCIDHETANIGRGHQTRVFLMERDPLDPDDLLAEAYTSPDVFVNISGVDDEDAPIEPYLKVHHACGARRGCRRIVEYPIPADKLNAIYHMGYVTLNNYFHGETVVCGFDD